MKNFGEELLKNEPHVNADGLLAEIKPLLDDYFVGEIVLENGIITYRLPNGQKFILECREVK